MEIAVIILAAVSIITSIKALKIKPEFRKPWKSRVLWAFSISTLVGLGHCYFGYQSMLELQSSFIDPALAAEFKEKVVRRLTLFTSIPTVAALVVGLGTFLALHRK